MKLLEDYKRELATIDSARNGLLGLIAAYEGANKQLKAEQNSLETHMEDLKRDFNKNMKISKGSFNEKKRLRARNTRDIRELKNKVDTLPRRKAYLEKMIRMLTAAATPAAPPKPAKKAVSGEEGITSVAGIIEDLSKKEAKPA